MDIAVVSTWEDAWKNIRLALDEIDSAIMYYEKIRAAGSAITEKTPAPTRLSRIQELLDGALGWAARIWEGVDRCTNQATAYAAFRATRHVANVEANRTFRCNHQAKVLLIDAGWRVADLAATKKPQRGPLRRERIHHVRLAQGPLEAKNIVEETMKGLEAFALKSPDSDIAPAQAWDYAIVCWRIAAETWQKVARALRDLCWMALALWHELANRRQPI